MSSVLSSICSELGEGVSYDPQTDTLYWFDIVGKKLHALSIATQNVMTTDLPIMASALSIIDNSDQWVFMQDGLYHRDMKTHCFTRIIAIEAENTVTRSNDARVHPSGAFWLGTMGIHAEDNAGAIYHYFGGVLTTLYRDITIPNAICFAPDGTKAYFTDTVKAQLMVVSCDPQTGLPTEEPKVFYDHSGGLGGLDGAVIDAHGRLINARWGASAVDFYAPDGERIASIEVPVKQPSCPAFFGKGLNRLAVTSAWQGMDETARLEDPLAGQLIEVTLPPLDPPLQGIAEPQIPAL